MEGGLQLADKARERGLTVCGICDKKINKAKAIVYRVRVSGLKGYAHATCWDTIATDTRVIRES